MTTYTKGYMLGLRRSTPNFMLYYFNTETPFNEFLPCARYPAQVRGIQNQITAPALDTSG